MQIFNGMAHRETDSQRQKTFSTNSQKAFHKAQTLVKKAAPKEGDAAF